MAFDTTFSIVDTFCPPSGYRFDEHELVLLENGHYLMIASDERIIDMSKLIKGGRRNAMVRGNHVAEMDANDNPVMIWRCWDHFQVTDAVHQELEEEYIDFVHMNSIDVDLDGNWIISSRHLSEVTKINRNTGDIVWRLGGKNDYFKWVNDLHRLSYQHDARVLPNGHYTIFDNGNFHEPEFSRALEVKLDTVNWTATKVFEFRNSPDISSGAEGNVQRLNNGNTLINWSGGEFPCLTEVRPDGSKAFELHVNGGTYRTTRSNWRGTAKIPYLIAEAYTDRITLLYNKFGDDDVSKYNVYGGLQPRPDNLIASTDKSFIHLTELDNENNYFFRVTAVNSSGIESGFSNEEEIYVDITPPGTNMIKNGDFSNRLNGWDFNVTNANATWGMTENDELKIVIFNGGNDISQIQLLNKDISLVRDYTYILEFDAFAKQSRVLEVECKKSKSPHTNYSKMGLVQLTKAKQHFSHQFIMEKPSDTRVQLIINAGGADHDVYIDNVSLKQVVTKVKKESVSNSFTDKLGANYPNPFNSQTQIYFSIPTTEHVSLDVYNIRGQKVKTLVNDTITAGHHEIKFDAQNLPSGFYLDRLRTENYQQVEKMLLVR